MTPVYALARPALPGPPPEFFENASFTIFSTTVRWDTARTLREETGGVHRRTRSVLANHCAYAGSSRQHTAHRACPHVPPILTNCSRLRVPCELASALPNPPTRPIMPHSHQLISLTLHPTQTNNSLRVGCSSHGLDIVEGPCLLAVHGRLVNRLLGLVRVPGRRHIGGDGHCVRHGSGCGHT